jgi:ketosteroid isomerase-like protein
MSRENVDLVLAWVDRWNRGDRSLGDELHPEIEIFSRFQPTPYRGEEGLQRWIAEIDEQFQTWEIDVDEGREAGDDRVVLLAHVHMRGHESGVAFDQPAGAVVDLEDGKLRRVRLFASPDEALEAASPSGGD